VLLLRSDQVGDVGVVDRAQVVPVGRSGADHEQGTAPGQRDGRGEPPAPAGRSHVVPPPGSGADALAYAISVPRSRSRRKVDFTPPATRASSGPGVSGRWVAPTMVTLLVLGLVWIVVYYITQASLPGMSALGGWNLIVGMGLITAGFMVATRWK
jgi:hypothetical protein